MHITTTAAPRTLTIRNGVGAGAHLVQARTLRTAGMHIDHATVVLVTAGRKTVAGCVAAAGDVMLLPQGIRCDVLNEAAGAAPYAALALFFDDALIRAALASRATVAAPTALPDIHPGLRQAIFRAHALMQDEATPLPIARHAALEVLAWLAVADWVFAPAAAPTFVERVRALLVRTPAGPWNAAVAAHAMHVSAATLRRRLARAQWTMGALLLDVRLHHALMLLQSGDDPVGRVALDAGFQNHAHFSRHFRQRFGITPTQLRQPAQLDRAGTTLARGGTRVDSAPA